MGVMDTIMSITSSGAPYSRGHWLLASPSPSVEIAATTTPKQTAHHVDLRAPISSPSPTRLPTRVDTAMLMDRANWKTIPYALRAMT